MPPLSAAGASKTSAAVVSASVEAHQLPPSSSTSVACSLPSSGISSTSSVTASFAPKPMVSQSAPSSSTSQSSVSGVAVSAVSSEGLHVHHHHHLHHHHHHHHHIVIAAPSPHHPSPSSPSTDVRTQNSTSAGTPASASVIDMKRTASTSSASNASPISPSNSYSVGTGSFSGVTSTAPTALALACGAGNGIEATTASTSMKLSAPSYAGGNVSASSSAVGPTGHHHQHPLTTSSGSGRLSVDMGAFWKPSMQQQQGGGVVMGGPTPLSLLHYHHATTAILGHSSTSLNQPPSNAIPMSTYMPLVEPSFFETIPMPEASALNWGEQSMPMMSADSLLKLAGSGLHQPILHVHLLSKKAASCSFFVELVNIAVNESMISEGPSSSTKRSRRPHRRRFQAAKLPGEKASSCLSSVIAQIRKNKRQYQIASDATSTSIPFPLPSTHPASYFSFPRLSSPSSARSSDDLLASTQARLAEANVRRLTRLHDRQTSIARRFEHVRYRVLLLRQGQRLAALKLRARSEYAMSAASLKRQLILKQSVDRYGAAVEHAQTVAMLHRLRKFLALRRAFSESALAASFSSAAAALERKADESSMDEEDGDDDVSEISPRHRALLASAFDGDVHHDAVGFLAHRGGSGEPHITTSELLSRAAGLLHPDPRHRLRVAGSDAWVLPAPIARGLEARGCVESVGQRLEGDKSDGDSIMVDACASTSRNTNDALRQKRKKVRRKFSQDQRVETSGNSLGIPGVEFWYGSEDADASEYDAEPARVSSPPPHSLSSRSSSPALTVTMAAQQILAGLIASSSASSILGLQQHAAHVGLTTASGGLERSKKRSEQEMKAGSMVDHDVGGEEGDDELDEEEEEEDDDRMEGRASFSQLGKIGENSISSGPPAGDLWAGSPSARATLTTPTKVMRRRSRSSSSNGSSNGSRNQRPRKSSGAVSMVDGLESRSSTVTAKLSLSDVGAILSPSITSPSEVSLGSSRPSSTWNPQASHPRDSHDDPMVGVRLTLTLPSSSSSAFPQSASSDSSVSTPSPSSATSFRPNPHHRRASRLGMSDVDDEASVAEDVSMGEASPLTPVHRGRKSSAMRGLVSVSTLLPALSAALSEPLVMTIKRCKSLPPHLFDTLDESDYLELLGLLPPITRFTLRELDMDEIISNVQLRHDLYFDPNLQFKPNVEGERGEQKRLLSTQYWTEVEAEVRAGYLFRIPLLLYEIRCIIVELLPYSEEMREDVERNIDVRLIAQQMEHGVLGVGHLMIYVARLLRANCAPARDVMLDEMMELCTQGKFTDGMRICFDVLEMMKLDYANHQLHRLRPYVVEHAIEFERNSFKDSDDNSTQIIKSWISDAFKRLQLQVPPPQARTTRSSIPTLSEVYVEALLYLINQSPVLAETTRVSSLVPESLRMDAVRLMTYRNDWQDVTIMAALLILFRQAAGAKCTSTHLATMKRNLWVLLNDAETSMQHIVLELGRVAGEIRGKPFSKQESELLSGMVDKTLSPKSKLYSMISGRVGEHLGAWMKTVLAASSGSNVHPTDAGVTSTTSDTSTAETPTQPSIVSAAAASTTSLAAPTLDKSKIARHGLTELEEEIRDLAERIGKLSEFNRATYFEVYAGIYEEVRGEAARASSSGTTNAGGSVACVGEPAGHGGASSGSSASTSNGPASSSASTATSAVSTVSTSTKSGDRGGGGGGVRVGPLD